MPFPGLEVLSYTLNQAWNLSQGTPPKGVENPPVAAKIIQYFKYRSPKTLPETRTMIAQFRHSN